MVGHAEVGHRRRTVAADEVPDRLGVLGPGAPTGHGHRARPPERRTDPVEGDPPLRRRPELRLGIGPGGRRLDDRGDTGIVEPRPQLGEPDLRPAGVHPRLRRQLLRPGRGLAFVEVAEQQQLEASVRRDRRGSHRHLRGDGADGEIEDAAVERQERRIRPRVDDGRVGRRQVLERPLHGDLAHLRLALREATSADDPEVVGHRAQAPTRGVLRGRRRRRSRPSEVLALDLVLGAPRQRPGDLAQVGEVHHGSPPGAPEHPVGPDELDRQRTELVEQRSEPLLDGEGADGPHEGWEHTGQHLGDAGGGGVAGVVERGVEAVTVVGGGRDGAGLHDR